VGDTPVEGYSNFLFVLIGAAFMRLGIHDPMPVLKGLGVASLLGSSVLVFILGRRWLPPAAATVPLVLLSGYSGTVLWAVSGLETGVYQCLLLLSVLLVVLAAEKRGGSQRRALLLGAAVCSVLLSLARPEGPVIVLVLLLFVAFGCRDEGHRVSLRSVNWLAAPFLSLYIPYFAWRVLYFGHLVPNSVACKAGHPAEPFEIITDFVWFGWIYGLLALASLATTRNARQILLWGIPLAYAFILYDVDPIMSHHNRHFLAALPLLLISATIGIQQLAQLSPALVKWRAERWLVAVIVALGAAVTLPALLRDIRVTAADGHPPAAPRRELATFLKARLTAEDSYVIGDTGLVPFLTGGTVIDAYCLNTREATGPELDGSPDLLADWILNREARFIVIQSSHADILTPVWDADRAIASHPRLDSEYRQIATFGRSEDVFHYFLFARSSA
ncbi:MAG: DUF2079 domain-containing protein, partial [Acidobacteriota bacterium]|nr:DUF2079 domain-containing protein [Acidobacteriota bacterium]